MALLIILIAFCMYIACRILIFMEISVTSIVLTMFSFVFAIPLIILWKSNRVRRRNEARERWIEKHTSELNTSFAQAVIEAQQNSWWEFGIDEIETCLRGLPEFEQDRAILIVVGDLDPPQIGDFRFEPEVISPLRHRLMMPRSWGTWLQFLLMLYWVVVGWMRFRGFGNIYQLVIPIAGILTVLLIEGAFIFRPAYFRFAPRMIQKLKYPLFGGDPDIINYPLAPGTTAHISTNRKGSMLNLLLKRGTNRDYFQIRRTDRAQPVIQRIWQTLLSTAPTPPLSKDQLLG